MDCSQTINIFPCDSINLHFFYISPSPTSRRAHHLHQNIDHTYHQSSQLSPFRLMNTNLYTSLASLAPLDSFEQHQANQLAEFSKMLSSFSTTNEPCINLCSKLSATGKASVANMSVDAIPFDSPLDQSLGSPASTRDFQESPLQDLEFDFTSTTADAPLFPDHGTQQQHSDNMLASLPLFGPEFSFSQQTVEAPLVGLKDSQPSSQASQNNNGNDYSFDAMARNMLSDMDNGRLNILSQGSVMRSVSPSAHSVASTNSSQEDTGITHLAAIFVREYARSHATHDIDVLLTALRVAGIEVSDEVVADILATASPLASAPTSASASPMSSQSPSPMVLPQAVKKVENVKKTRSSLQKSRSSIQKKEVDTKKFVCETCNKTFDRAFNLRTHRVTHTALQDREKPYVCPWSECNKPFMRKYDAIRHYESVHVKRGECASKKEIQKAFSGEHGVPAPSAIAALFSDDITQANG